MSAVDRVYHGNPHHAATEFAALLVGLVDPRGGVNDSGHWIPDNEELADCCQEIWPHLEWNPEALWSHLRAAYHCATRHNVRVADLYYAVEDMYIGGALSAPNLPVGLARRWDIKHRNLAQLDPHTIERAILSLRGWGIV